MGRQIGDKADRVGQDGGAPRRQFESPHRRVEGREQHVLGGYRGARQAVEQGRFSGIGVADQRDNRIRHAAARLAMQGAGALDRLELALQPRDALADQPAVDFELALAGAAEKAEAAALAFEMGPRTHQPRALIGERRQFDLQAALMGTRPRAEDFEDQTGSVDDLRLPAPFKVALLHRRKRPVDHDETDRIFADKFAEIFDGAAAEQAARARAGDAGDFGANDIEMDRLRQADRLFEPRFERTGKRFATPRTGADFGAGWTTSARPVVAPSASGSLSSARLRILVLPARLEQLDRLRRHHRRDRVLVDELRMRVAPQQHAEIIKPGDDPLQLYPVDQKDRNRRLVLPDVVKNTSWTFCDFSADMGIPHSLFGAERPDSRQNGKARVKPPSCRYEDGPARVNHKP